MTQRCIIHTLLSGSQTIFLIRSLYIYSQSIVSTSNTAFWWVLHMQTEWVPDDPARTHDFGLRVQNLGNPIFMLGIWLWMHCTVLIDCTEPVAFVCADFDRYSHSPLFQASVDCIHHLHRNFGLDWEFLVEVFYLFFGTGFVIIPPTFFNSRTVRIKYSLISNCFDVNYRDHLLGIIVSTWIFSGYEAVFPHWYHWRVHSSPRPSLWLTPWFFLIAEILLKVFLINLFFKL